MPAHPYEPIAHELRERGIEARAEESPVKLFGMLCRIKGVEPPDCDRNQAKKVLKKYAATKKLDFSNPKEGRKRIEAEYKPLRWPTCQEQSQYMMARKKENLERSLANPNENWMAEFLQSRKARGRWIRQYQWGYRIFDFFNIKLGVAIEVDGPEHDEMYDRYRDVYNFLRSGIVVLRVRNKNVADAKRAIRFITLCDTRGERRRKIALSVPERKDLLIRWKKGLFYGDRLLIDTIIAGKVPSDPLSYERRSSIAVFGSRATPHNQSDPDASNACTNSIVERQEERPIISDLIPVTKEMIEAGKSLRGGWSKAQLAMLGVPWPPSSGWKSVVVGRHIKQSELERFLSLR